MVEGAANHFKQAVMAVLFSAYTVGGPITTRHMGHAAKFVCCAHERFMKQRRFDTCRGSSTTWVPPWTLNIGTAPRFDRLPPWGSAGYGYVPKELRNARGAPKYARAEPVLLIGFQHMYTSVYKLEGGIFDADRMHFGHSLMRQGFAAAAQTQGSDDMSGMGQFINRVNAEAYMAMRDVDWRDYLFGPEHEAVMIAYNKEWTSLEETGGLLELDPMHPEGMAAHLMSACKKEYNR